MQKLGLPMPVACASACMRHHSCGLVHMCKEFCCSSLCQKGTKGPETTACRNIARLPVVTNQRSQYICRTGRHTRHSTVDTLFGHHIFRVCTFPLWPFMFFWDQSQKSPPPPPPGPGPPKWRQNYIHPSFLWAVSHARGDIVDCPSLNHQACSLTPNHHSLSTYSNTAIPQPDITGAAASQCVTPRGVRQFGGL